MFRNCTHANQNTIIHIYWCTIRDWSVFWKKLQTQKEMSRLTALIKTRRRQRSLPVCLHLKPYLHIWRAERSSAQSLHSTGLGAAGTGSSWGAAVWSWGPVSPRPHQQDAPAARQQVKPMENRWDGAMLSRKGEAKMSWLEVFMGPIWRARNRLALRYFFLDPTGFESLWIMVKIVPWADQTEVLLWNLQPESTGSKPLW